MQELFLFFRRLLRILLSELGSGDVESRTLVLIALCEMMKKRSLTQRFQSYVELVVLKVVHAYGDSNKEVGNCLNNFHSKTGKYRVN